MNRLTREEITDALLNDTKATRQRFLAAFPLETENFTNALKKVYDKLAGLDGSLPESRRSAWSLSFMFNAANSLLTSFHLFINGFQIPAGNLMRHWSEALAMALLCSDYRIDTLKALEDNPSQFPVQKAMSLVMRDKNANILGISKEAWMEFKKANDLYQEYSHASVLSLATTAMMTNYGGLIIGGEFDHGKLSAYEKEFSRRISACSFSEDIAAMTERHLLQQR